MKPITGQPKMKHELGLLDGTMLVAGSMIGSGIFIVSADITRNVGSAAWLIFVWIITGFMTITAAVSYGELSAMFPKAGGQYVYLKEAYNKLIAFLYGWSFFAVIQTGTIAAVGVAFSKFTAYLIPAVSEDNILYKLQWGGEAGSLVHKFNISAAQLVSIVIIMLLTFINTKGIKSGKLIQNTFTITKLLSLFGLIIFGFVALKGDIWHANWSDAWNIHKLLPDGSFGSLNRGSRAWRYCGIDGWLYFQQRRLEQCDLYSRRNEQPKTEHRAKLVFGNFDRYHYLCICQCDVHRRVINARYCRRR